MDSSKKKIVIVGGGPAGMLAAIELSKKHEVHLFEKGKTLGRKFLVAGKGGFNLSNNVTGQELISKYSSSKVIENSLVNFDSSRLRNWLNELEIPTYIGSSGRIFPKKGIKPIQVLAALKNRLLSQGTKLYFTHEFINFNATSIEFLHKKEIKLVSFDYCIFALGGGSWSVTGSNNKWIDIFNDNNISTKPFEPSNCGLEINFVNKAMNNFIGTPLKNICVSCNGTMVKGEAVVSSYGLEGNAIYPISRIVRESLKKNQDTFIELDLKPFNSEEDLIQKTKENTMPKNYGYLFKLNKAQIALIKVFTDKETYLNPVLFAKALKKLVIPITALRPVEEAISTVGGISLEELDENLSLKKIPNIYIAGEMFDWDTITGGFLLQGCFSTAMHVAKNILAKNE